MRPERPVISGHRWKGGVAPGSRVVHGDAAQAALRRGMTRMAAAMRPTLGPLARTVAVAPAIGTRPPEVLDDGALIARRVIELDDPFANMGAMLLRHMVWQVHERVGDGTATTAVLAQELMEAAAAYVVAGGHPLAVRRGIERCLAIVLAELRRMARPIDTPAEIAGVVRGIVRDPMLATTIGEVLDTVGPDGDVQIKDGSLAATTCEYVDGVRWSEGVVSTAFLPDGERTVTLDHPRIFVTDRVLERAEDLVPAVDACLGTGCRSLVVIAPEVRGEALTLLLLNRERGVLDGVMAVKPPGFGDQQTAALEDLAVIAGARCVRKIEFPAMSRVAAGDLGTARQVWATRTLTGLLGGQSDRGCLRRRVADLRVALRRVTDGAERAALQQRLGRLTGASVILRVGGTTKTEQVESKQRIEAALAAGRAALRDGVVPGGGSAFVACLARLDAASLDGDEAVGVRLLAQALPGPLSAIVRNAGLEAFPIVDETERSGAARVFDVVHRAWVDPWETGLVDPVATLATALEVAVSGVTGALTTHTLIRGAAPEVARTP